MDEFTIIRRRAQQASKFYNAVGLSNGDLPRDVTSPRVDKNRWSTSPEKKNHAAGSAATNSSGLSQPSTPSKYGAAWLELSKPATAALGADPKAPSTAARFRTLPNKFSPERSHDVALSPRSLSTSHGSTPLSPLAFKESGDTKQRERVKTPRKFSYDYISTTKPSEQLETTTNNDEKKKQIEGDDATQRVESNHQANGIDTSEPARVTSHLYEKQLQQTPEHRNSSSSDQLTPVIFGRKKSSNSRKASDSECGKSSDKRNALYGPNLPSFDSFMKLEPLERRRSRSDARPEMSSSARSSVYATDSQQSVSNLLNADDDRGSSTSLNENKTTTDSITNLFKEYRKNKSSHSSPVVKHHKKAKTDLSPNDSNRASPKHNRRTRNKKHKSDVTDHRNLIERLRLIQKEKEEQEEPYPFIIIDYSEAAKKRRHFSHYDWQSMLFSFKDTLVGMETLKRKNTTSGASRAAALAAVSTDSLASKGSSHGSQEDVSMHMDEDDGFESNRANVLVASCPFFRNEIGGELERNICISASPGLNVQVGNDEDKTTTEAQNILTNHGYLSIMEGEHSDSLMPPDSPPRGSVSFGIENVDNGANYYRTHFYERDHVNYFGIDDRFGPIVYSFRREKLDEKGAIYQYRIIVRTCELRTLRGSILEEAVPIGRHPPSKGYSAKDVFEHMCSEVGSSCLKLGAPTPKVHEQIMKIDEQNLNFSYKVGVLYCKAGQVTEEDMYNNEHGSESFNTFLQLLGTKIKLNGFDDFKGGLDVRTDSTGTESVFTTFRNRKIMFHVSTLLPFTPTNRQQLLRKRHIGNDIVTIIFQEPGSEPFDPRHIRSHFQHVFIVVRVHFPCTSNTCYSVAVTRSRNIPRFGPPLSENSMFPPTPTFRNFLLTKVINGENIAHNAGKFKALAMNTREQYLRDLALNSLSQNSIEGPQRLGRFSIASKKMKENKEKQKVKPIPELYSHGALTWNVNTVDYSDSQAISCVLGISDCVLVIAELQTKQLIFSIPCQAVLGWRLPPATPDQQMTNRRDLQIYYGRGEKVSVETEDPESREEIVIRLVCFTKGVETIYRHLRRNKMGELGFRVNYEGIVVQLKEDGYAAQDGLKQSSRLVEICKVAVTTMSHEQINDLLRTSSVVTVVIIPPNDDGTPRKCSMELYHLSPVLKVKSIDLKNLSAPPSDSWHERSQSEPVHSAPHNGNSVRRTSGDVGYPEPKYHYEDQGDYRASLDQSKVKVQKPVLSKTESGNNTKATLYQSSSRTALVGCTSSYQELRNEKDPEHSNAVPKRSSATAVKRNSSFLSNHLNSDWSRGLNNRHTTSNHSLSSDSGMNSNNNSSYSSTLSRCSNNNITPSNQQQIFNEKLESKFSLQNSNGNNNIASNHLSPDTRRTLPRTNPPIRAVVWNPTSTLPTKSTFASDSLSSPTPTSIPLPSAARRDSAEISKSKGAKSDVTAPRPRPRLEASPSTTRRNKPVPIPRSTRKLPSSTPSTYTPSPINKRIATDVPPPPSLKESLKNSSSSNLASSWTPSDVHSTLLRMLAADRPKEESRPSPTVRNAITANVKRRPTARSKGPRPPRPKPIFRTVSDESLCGARTEGVASFRLENSSLLDSSNETRTRQFSASVDSLVQPNNRAEGDGNSPIERLSSFPLPVNHEWEDIVDAARAAEGFDATSMRSASMGTLNENHDPSSKWNGKRTVSMEHLCDHNDLADDHLLPSSTHHVEDMINRSLEVKPTDADERLERIERKLLLLQKQLKKEQQSKKLLEKEVTLLRRDNTLLLRHTGASNTDLYSGSKKLKKKSSDKG